MVKLDPTEMHLLVLICSNPDHPQNIDVLERLGPIARAIAILVLKDARAPESFGQLPPIPNSVSSNASDLAEVKVAAKEFAQMAQGRRAEHHRARRAMPA